MAVSGSDNVVDDDGEGGDFVEYLERHLAERGWTVHDFCEHSGLKPSVVFRWRKGYRPDIGNARIMAKALSVPLLEVLVKAGRLTAAEANADVRIVPELSEVPVAVLMRELAVRVARLESDEGSRTEVRNQ
ncbi:helix-turn-helix domain-containing protein [Saccharopolyspora sp. NPDC003752]